jgi:competence protein ComFC
MNCGSGFCADSALCLRCLNYLARCFRSESELNIQGIKLKTLMIWNPNQSDLLSNLIIQLKHSDDKTWSILAQEFLMSRNSDFADEAILVSLASEDNKSHGQMWGQGLSELTGIPHIMGLTKVHESRSQKGKNRSQRQNLELQLIVDISVLKNRRVIFVDDVVTTGATLLAAHKALGLPDNFECWSLCYRNSLSIAN